MSKALITQSYLTNIANSIRTKLGVQTTYTPSQMSGAIDSIPTGGGSDADLIKMVERPLTGNVSITIPDGTTTIGLYAFANFWMLQSVSIPNGVTSILDYAFDACGNLQLTSLPSGLTRIGDYAFKGCSNLNITNIPSSVTTIGNYIFQNCVLINTITFNGTPTTIGSNAFANSSVYTINVPWAEGAVAGAPWGAMYPIINYNYTPT